MPDPKLHDPVSCTPKSYHWHLAPTDEAGWHCSECGGLMPGEPPGYSPQLDRIAIGSKVDSILQELHMQDFVYVSNSTDGDSTVHVVSEACKNLGAYDQITIIKLICNGHGHRKYWTELGEAILAGKDPRSRCWCGKLANRSSGRDHYCSDEHQRSGDPQGRLPFEASVTDRLTTDPTLVDDLIDRLEDDEVVE